MRNLVKMGAVRRTAWLACGAALLGGCTTSLWSYPDLTADTPATRGIPYRMPAATYDITVTWALKKCIRATAQNPRGDVEFTASGAFKPAIVEGEARVIDYRLLTNHFKTGDIKVEFHDKTALVKSINATIEGHEAEATSEAIKFGATVARLVAGLPSPAAGGGAPGVAPPPPSPCLEAAVDMLTELDTATARIKAIPEEAKKLEDRMAVLRVRLAGGRLTKPDRAELVVLQQKADALAAELTELTAASAKLKQTLTYSETWTFPDTPAARAMALSTNAAKVKKWQDRILKPAAVAALPADIFTAAATLTPLSTEASCATNACGKAERAEGFVFRLPVQANLHVVSPIDPKPLVDETVSVPQFGRLRVLPLSSEWGEKNTLSATFAADGVPTMIEYKSLNAPGVAFFKSGNQAAGQILALRTELEAQRKADAAAAKADAQAATKAELDALTHRQAMLEAQAKIDALEKTPDPTLEALQAEVAIQRLQKEQSDLRAAIRKNEAP